MAESTADCVCSCERLRVMNTSSLKPGRRSSESVMLITFLILLNYLTCCVAWPMLNQRRSFNYAPQQPLPDYDLDLNQWAVAEEPQVGRVIPDAYYDLPSLQQQDVYDQFYEDPEETYQMPYFGQIVDSPEPEEELELEELKHEQPYTYDKRRSGRVMNTKKPSVAPATTPGTAAATPKSSTVAPKVGAAPAAVAATRGQKEIPMLRPPQTKSHGLPEPQITVAQRSPNEKLSAYDKLRKYLSLDDALKKEYEQRKANAVSRHTKRESISSIITDSDSLTGQLNSLKKKMD